MSVFNDFIYFNKNRIAVLVLVSILGVGAYFGINYYRSMLDESKEIEEVIADSSTKADANEKKEIEEKEEIEEESQDDSLLMVDVKGEIEKPGVYELAEGKRVIDAIKLAGGLKKQADTSLINLSKKISDGMVIIIYSKTQVANLEKQQEIEEKAKALCTEKIVNDACTTSDEKANDTKEESNTQTTTNTKISLNNATLEQLETLPGIGESKARNIIDYRNQKKFTKIEELLEVDGIGESIFAKIKENLTL